MKKLLIVVASLTVLIAFGWGGIWFVGKTEIEQRVDLEIAQAEARGWTITHEGRSVGGFPTGYKVTLDMVAATNGETGLLIRLPSLVLSVDATDPSRIRIDLPETFVADYPFSEAARLDNPSLPKVLTVTGEAKEMSLWATGAAQTGHRLDLIGKSLSWTVAQQDVATRATMELTNIEAAVEAPLAPGMITRRLTASTVTFEASATDATEENSTLARYEDVSVSGRSDIRTLDHLAETVYGGASGIIDGAYQTGRGSYQALIGEAGAQSGGLMRFESASSTGLFLIKDGRIELSAETRENTMTLEPNEPTSSFAGTFNAAASQARYALPTAPSDTPSDMRLRIAFIGVGASDDVWARLDPEGNLDRTPGDLVVDLSGTMRVRKRIDETRPGEAPPFEVANVLVNEASLKALGSAATIAGDIEVLQPISLPMGSLSVTLSKPSGLIMALSKAKLITPEMAQMGDAMLQVYAKPEGTDDEWTSDITFSHEGITVNGLSIR